MRTTEYDVFVLGAGAVGENIADRAVQGKALLLHAARHVPGATDAVTGRLDTAAVLARRGSFTSNWSDAGQVAWAPHRRPRPR